MAREGESLFGRFWGAHYLGYHEPLHDPWSPPRVVVTRAVSRGEWIALVLSLGPCPLPWLLPSRFSSSLVYKFLECYNISPLEHSSSNDDLDTLRN